MSEALQQSEPESLNQTKDRIMADIEALEEALIDLNLMMVVRDTNRVGTTNVKFGSEMDTNGPVFTEIEDHPVHVEKVMDHDLLCLKHEDAGEYRKNKRDQY